MFSITIQVRANVVRALGNLARFVDFSANSTGRSDGINHVGIAQKNMVYPHTSEAPASQWLGTMVQTFVSCVTTGNVKVSAGTYSSLCGFCHLCLV